MLEPLGTSFDDDEAELGVVDDDAGEVVLRGVVANLGLVRRVGEVANPVEKVASVPGEKPERGKENALVAHGADAQRLVLGLLRFDLLVALIRRELARRVRFEMLLLSSDHLAADLRLDLGRVDDRVLGENAHHVRELDCGESTSANLAKRNQAEDAPFGGGGGKSPILTRSCLSCSSAALRCLRIFFNSFFVRNNGFGSTLILSWGAGIWMGC